jgi:Indole-3-glycerol phosphate synthase
LSESISEGDGISILVEVTPDAVLDPESFEDAVGVLVSPGEAPAVATVPVVVRGGSPADAAAAGADAWLLVAAQADSLTDGYTRTAELGLECIVEIHDEEELEQVLAEIDPEIVLLSPEDLGDGGPGDGVLALLPDVPAGKLAIGALPRATEEEVSALERAGVDAVLIDAAHAATLFRS